METEERCDRDTVSAFLRDRQGLRIARASECRYRTPTCEVLGRTRTDIHRRRQCRAKHRRSRIDELPRLPEWRYERPFQGPGGPQTMHGYPGPPLLAVRVGRSPHRSEEHTSELQSHSFISYAAFC